MSFANIYNNCLNQFDNLDTIIDKSQIRLIQTEPDQFFIDHSNFLIKSFLISLCSYLEAYLKEIANYHVELIRQRILKASVPHNIILWSLDSKSKEKELAFKQYNISITKKDIDDELSGNPFRTSKLFGFIGIDLESNQEFKRNKEIINAVVAKRNSIIHHNDAANDISLGDIKSNINVFKVYIKSIQDVVDKS